MALTDPVLTGHREGRTITYGDCLERRIEGPGPAKRRAVGRSRRDGSTPISPTTLHAGAAHTRRNDNSPAANAEHTQEEQEDDHTKQSADNLAILEQLNKDFFHSDQFSDAKRVGEFLAEDFISQFPGVTRNRAEFLDYIAQPRPFKDLAMHDVNVRILSDVALIHGRATYTMLADGAQQEALYTDAYQKRDGTWVCVAACAIAPGA